MENRGLTDYSYGPVPWWGWNGFLEKDELIRQLEMIRNAGIREFFIYASYGLERPVFLSDEWFEYVRFILDAAKERGMKVWFCDDLNWPSGTAGGRVLRDHPEYRMWNLKKELTSLAPGERVLTATEENLIWRGLFTGKNEFLRELSPGETYVADGPVQLCVLKKSLVRSIYFHNCGAEGTWNQEGYLDMLNPAAVHCWMGYIHEEYRKRFPEYFHSVIQGFFHDEPFMTEPHHSDRIPWTNDLEDDFESRYGYPCRPHLWRLFYQASGSEQFRYDFWRLTADRFAGAFSRQVAGWCAANQISSTGHGWPEEPACQRLELNMTGNLHEFLCPHQIPGTDLLDEVTGFSSAPSPWYNFGSRWARNLLFSAKMPSSTARYTGSSQVLCEAFGVRSWNSTLAGQRRITDFLAGMGINLINDNSLQYSIAEFRKRGGGGKHFTQPYFRYYHLFAEYVRRICRFAASGRLDTEIAVLNPSACRMAATEIAPDTAKIEKTPLPPEADTAEAILSTIDALVRGHRDFELLFDEVVLNSRIENGTLIAPNAEFKVILLPQCHVLNDRVSRILSDFERSGGTLIAIGTAPGEKTVADGRRTEGKCILHPVSVLDPRSDDFPERLMKEIARVVPPTYSLKGSGSDCILTALRLEKDRRTLLMSNQGEQNRTFFLKRSLPGKMAIFNPDDGVRYRVDEARPMELEPGQSVIAVFDDSSPDHLPELRESPLWTAGKKTPLKLETRLWKPAGKIRNSLLCRLEMRPHGPGEFQVVTADGDTPFELDPDRFSHVDIRGEFAVFGEVPDDLSIVFDTDAFDRVEVNGTAVPESEPYTLWDFGNRRMEIAAACRPGVNTFTLRWKIQKWYSERYHLAAHFSNMRSIFEPIALCGEFGGSGATVFRVPNALRPGDLCEQGFPDFAGSLTLTSEFFLTEPGEFRFLELSSTDAVCEVTINEVLLGVRAWNPRRFGIPRGVLRPGRNAVVLTLSNSLGNLIRRHFDGERSPKVPFVLPEFAVSR